MQDGRRVRVLPGTLHQPQPGNTGRVSVERPPRAEEAVPSPSHTPPPSEQWALLLPRVEEEEAGPGLGRIWDSVWVRGGAEGRDSSGVAGQPPRAPWAAGLSSPQLRIRFFFLSKRVEVSFLVSADEQILGGKSHHRNRCYLKQMSLINLKSGGVFTRLHM